MAGAPVLITGAAGFIGFAVARRLLADGRAVVGVDDLCAAYDPALKEARLAVLRQSGDFTFQQIDLAEQRRAAVLFDDGDFGPVVHLAARAGVRQSLDEPHAFGAANLTGFLNVLEGCRHRRTGHLVYASSSSVYGTNQRLPYSTHDNADHPVSLYAATKKANEAMAHAYSHLFALPATGLRFFTVYGPWGRPDMAMWLFAEAIMQGRPIRLFNHGRMQRDFTYIDDAAEAVVRLIGRPPQTDSAVSTVPAKAEASDPATSSAPWRIYNVGNSAPIAVLDLVRLLEREIGKPAVCEYLPMQPGDVAETSADCADLERAVGFRPKTSIEDGVRAFVAWFRDFRK
jgi:UDP-glucuronate 4-epimerase